jgi:Acetyltransferase (GNAT) domain
MIEFYPVVFERLDREKWDDLVDRSGLVFQTSSWLLLWEKTFPFTSYVYLAMDGENIIGGIPFCIREKFKFKEAYSMPRGCYGGAVVDDNMDKKLVRQLEEEFTIWCLREGFTRINLVGFSPEVNTALESFTVRPLATHILNLKYSSDEQLNKLANSHKRNLPKAFEKEFKLEKISTIEDVGEYYTLLKETASRQGREPFYRFEFYKTLLEIFRDNSKLHWNKVVFKGNTVASAIVFIHRDMAMYWDGVSTELALEKGANFFLFWNLIQMLKKDNIETLNFGASPKKRPGLKRFKAGWGAEKYSYFEYNYQKPLARLAGKIKGFF